MNCDALQIIHCYHQSNHLSIFLFDVRSYSMGYSGLSIDLSGCASLELSGTRKGD